MQQQAEGDFDPTVLRAPPKMELNHETQIGHDDACRNEAHLKTLTAKGTPLFGECGKELSPSDSFSEEEPAPEPHTLESTTDEEDGGCSPVTQNSVTSSASVGHYQRRWRPSSKCQAGGWFLWQVEPSPEEPSPEKWRQRRRTAASAVLLACAVAALVVWQAVQWKSTWQAKLVGAPASHKEMEDLKEMEDPQLLGGEQSEEEQEHIVKPFKQGREISPGRVKRSELLAIELTRMYVPLHTVGSSFQFFSAYYGDIDVGGKRFTVMFDTGSGNVILPSTYCFTETCVSRTRYSRRDSPTAVDLDFDGRPAKKGSRDQITIVFGTGHVDGVLVEDTACPVARDMTANTSLSEEGTLATDLQAVEEGKGGDSKHLCTRMPIIAATAMSEMPFSSFTFDGVVGLALPAISHLADFNFVERIAPSMANFEYRKTFSVFLAHSDSTEASEITFGGYDEGHIATNSHGQHEIAWQAVKHADLGHWILHLSGIYIEDVPGNSTRLDLCREEDCSAAMDTGTATLTMPKMAFRPMYAGLWHRPMMDTLCEAEYPKVHFELTDFNITMGPKDYSAMVNGNGPIADENKTVPEVVMANSTYCKPLLMVLNLEAPLGPNLYIIGEPALRKYYTIYDAANTRVGISLAKHVDDGDERASH